MSCVSRAPGILLCMCLHSVKGKMSCSLYYIEVERDMCLVLAFS